MEKSEVKVGTAVLVKHDGELLSGTVDTPADETGQFGVRISYDGGYTGWGLRCPSELYQPEKETCDEKS